MNETFSLRVQEGTNQVLFFLILLCINEDQTFAKKRVTVLYYIRVNEGNLTYRIIHYN